LDINYNINGYLSLRAPAKIADIWQKLWS